MTTTRHDKVAGIFLGAAVGDALGWPQEDRSQIVGGKAARIVEPRPEFRSWTRHGGTQFGRYLDPVGAGEYSDDTQLLLAVAHSCLRGSDWFEWFTRIELPLWGGYQRGGGGAVLRASRAWADGGEPWVFTSKRDMARAEKYFLAGANGVAMRIAPHVAVTASGGIEELLHRVVLDGLTTHGHPRAILGGCVHALGLRHALLHEGTLEYGELLESVLGEAAWRDPAVFFDTVPSEWVEAYGEVTQGRGPMELAASWKRTVEEVQEKLRIARVGLARGALADDQQTLREIGCFGKESGSGTVTAVGALYVGARTATQPVSGLLRTAFLENADTDTLCSMTGSLLGAIHGTRWLNEMATSVQDHEHLRRNARAVADIGLSDSEQLAFKAVPSDIRHVKEWMTALFENASADYIPDGRSFEVLEIQELETKTKNFAVRIVGRTGDGQTLFFDRLSKTPNEAVRQANPARLTPHHDTSSSTTAEHSDGRAAALIEPELVAVEIKVDDLNAALQFYRDVLGVPCRMAGEKLHVGEGLILSAETPDRGIRSHRGVIITLSVGDLKRAAARIESAQDVEFRWAEDGKSFWLKDPSDNRIRITSSNRVH
ncbi:ADP-ribosylglycohydrolase family protein [Rhodococcus sp. WAY2]|uniref:ADP-ribosylglycohydrolase family protein n=1 Tax=Rhodococcus sp. WAY2 TaxID=2663121 RepID=UPI00131FD591|nr:ADP-ribosylglycohydrolase family protein [Rhodococcus sp. WAY2]QHE73620.1 putative Cytosolic Protein [Rhodococcus sp. WAY2]